MRPPPAGPLGTRGAIFLSALAILCSAPLHGQSVPRRWSPDSWVVTKTFPSRDDTLLLNPELLVVLDSTIILTDAADRRIKAFSTNGTFQWAFGRSGQGPKEFQTITDIKLAPDRSVWLNDPANSRITVLSVDGHFIRSFRTANPLHRIVPLRDSSFLAFSGSNTFLVHYSPTGIPIAKLPEPSFLDGVYPRAAESVFLTLSDGSIVAGYRWTSHLVRFDSVGRRLWQTEGRSPTPFPSFGFQKVKVGKTPLEIGRIAATAQQTTMGLSATDKSILALVSDRSSSGNAIVDAYDLITGGYKGSSELPVPAVAITYYNKLLYMLAYDPFPRIVLAKQEP